MTTPIKHLVQNIFAGQKDWRLKIIKKWPTIIGPLHERVSIEKIINDTVYLAAVDSCWLTEIHLLSNLVLKNINDMLGEMRIKHLKLSLKEARIIRPLTYSHVTPSSIEYIISPKEKKALDGIRDSTLQKVLEKFLARCKQQ